MGLDGLRVMSDTSSTGYDTLAVNPALERLLLRLPAHVRATFSSDQIEALGRASMQDPSSHMVAVRRTLPLLGGRYYLAVFVGRDRRRKLTSLERFIMRGMKESWFRRLLTTFALFAVAALIALGSLCVTYLVKSALGIDLLQGPSVLHDLLYWR